MMALRDDFEPVHVQLLHRSPLPTLNTAIFKLVRAETRSSNLFVLRLDRKLCALSLVIQYWLCHHLLLHHFS
jgi:hypothetical protein